MATATAKRETLNVPEWANGVRVGKNGIIFVGGKMDTLDASVYRAGPYSLERYGNDRQWNFWSEGKSRLGFGRSFEAMRWYATKMFFKDLIGNAYGEVVEFFKAPTPAGDWLTFRVLADKLDDLGHDEAAALVRHFLPK